MMHPIVRIFVMDTVGKTTICEALERQSSDIVTFAHTPEYAYRWLRTYGVPKTAEVTSKQVNLREFVFSKVNECEAYTHRRVSEYRPVAAVRGRADTLISAQARRCKAMPQDMATLFPKYLRPDILVLLQAPLWIIEQRLDELGESKTGANSMRYHAITKTMYEQLATLAKKFIPVLSFDTGKADNTPDFIATSILGAIHDYQEVRK